jgi:hypothetical protein
MTPRDFIDTQEIEIAKVLELIHNIIVSEDEKVSAAVGSMMGKEMILYSDCGAFRYGLASTKNYLSLHLLPMYSSPDIYERYKKLLPKAKFQKGCINFKTRQEMPSAIVAKLIHDCSKVDMVAIRNKQLQAKKVKTPNDN